MGADKGGDFNAGGVFNVNAAYKNAVQVRGGEVNGAHPAKAVFRSMQGQKAALAVFFFKPYEGRDSLFFKVIQNKFALRAGSDRRAKDMRDGKMFEYMSDSIGAAPDPVLHLLNVNVFSGFRQMWNADADVNRR
jgi:hypothetical protein